MSSLANVTIHKSQFPENVRRDLINSLRTGQVNHKFHYDSVKQAQNWLALHHAYSPSRTDPDCAAIYDRSFKAVANQIKAKRVHLIGLGCGGGQKDTRLLRMLSKKGTELFYTPSDVSTAMVLIAREAALKVIPDANCSPFVCDLVLAKDLPRVIQNLSVPDEARVITFFGMIPNFKPDVILPRISKLLRHKDRLLFSANLAPGADYQAGMRKILPLYDNALTRDWLMTFLLDLGVEAKDGKIFFEIEDVTLRGLLLKRIAAYFRFNRETIITLENRQFRFSPQKPLRLFFSYRHTPAIVHSLLRIYRNAVTDQWITKSEEEGVFLCQRT